MGKTTSMKNAPVKVPPRWRHPLIEAGGLVLVLGVMLAVFYFVGTGSSTVTAVEPNVTVKITDGVRKLRLEPGQTYCVRITGADVYAAAIPLQPGGNPYILSMDREWRANASPVTPGDTYSLENGKLWKTTVKEGLLWDSTTKVWVKPAYESGE